MRTPLLLGACLLLLSGSARALERDLCLAPHEHAQELRRDGHLKAARDELRSCARDPCPGPVRTDCTQWLAELQAAIPTVVVEAKDAAGRDVGGLRVHVDGAAVPDFVDGRPFEMDPGPHEIRFLAAGRSYVESVVVREGDRDRVLSVTFASDADSSPKAAAPPPQTHRPVPASAWMAGGVGVLGLGTFAAFGLLGLQKHASLRSSCAPSCTDAQKSPVVTDYVVSDVGLGVSVVSLALATWLVVTRPSVPRTETSRVSPWIGPRGGGLLGEF